MEYLGGDLLHGISSISATSLMLLYFYFIIANNNVRYVPVSVKASVSSVSPTGEASYLATAADTYHNGGAKITLGTPSISADGKTITIPETITYGGYWFARGGAADGSASRNITITLNL